MRKLMTCQGFAVSMVAMVYAVSLYMGVGHKYAPVLGAIGVLGSLVVFSAYAVQVELAAFAAAAAFAALIMFSAMAAHTSFVALAVSIALITFVAFIATTVSVIAAASANSEELQLKYRFVLPTYLLQGTLIYMFIR